MTPGSGTTETGTLATGLSTNLYQFSGTAGESVYFESLNDSPADASYVTFTTQSTASSQIYYLDSDAHRDPALHRDLRPGGGRSDAPQSPR